MVLGGGKEVWLLNGVLTTSQATKELPPLGFQFEVVGNERPIERWRPVGDVVVFMYPGLVISVMGGKLDGGAVLVNGVVSVPVTEREFGRNGDVLLKLLELGSSVALSVWDANGGGADVEVAMLMVAALRLLDVEI